MPKLSPVIRRPDVLSRGVLDASFKLLRPHHPGLALQLQNILAGERFSLRQHAQASAITDHFHIQLDPRTVGKIVDALTQLGNAALQQHNSEPGALMVLRTLIKEWMSLAEWIVQHAEQNLAAQH